ncbi:MAG: Flp pilus assembly protein CpaB [Chloroflexi bacterium]|nr:Flp pilus assembly protein CpaB [Chloroflexota bacterium]
MGGRKVLLVAVVLGLISSVLVGRYIQQLSDAAKPTPLEPVLVAAQDVPARTLLTDKLLSVKLIPVTGRHPQALTTAQPAVGKVTKMAIAGGEQILPSKLFNQRDESGLAFVVPPGKRAVSVALSEVIGSGGLIAPGDRVDVVAVFSGEERNQDVATMVLQNIEVLAVAQRLEGDPPPESTVARVGQQAGLSSSLKDGQKADSRPQAQARSVTLSVSPDEATRLVLAEERGKIRLALRGYRDESLTKPVPVALKSLNQ